MALGKGKFFGLWVFIIGATLYFPFKAFLEAAEYESADHFFETLLMRVIALSIILVPLALILGARRKRKARREKQERKSAAAGSS